jgi:predicted DNA binding protein
MAVFASFDYQTKAFTETFGRLSKGVLDCKSIDTCPDDSLLISAIVEGADFQLFEEGLNEDPTIDQHICLNPGGSQRIYRIKQSDNIVDPEVYNKIVEERGVFIDTVRLGDASPDRGVINISFPNKESVQRFNDFCSEIGFPLSLNSIHENKQLINKIRPTPKQKEILLLALDEGYFNVPQETTLEELAVELNISQQSASELVRRGINQLLTQYRKTALPRKNHWEY